VRQTAFTILLMALRAVVPLLVYFFDTFIWYTVTSSCVSIYMATYQRIGRVASWSQLVRTLDLSVELFNQKVLNLDDADGDAAATANPAAAETSTPARRGLPGCISRFLAAAGGPEGARRPWERDDNFAFEPRSRQWQYFGRAWNEIVISLRDGDLLSDAEVTNLCFRFLADETTFGVPEYVIYPSMLSSPVFTLLVARGVFRTSYPSFARTLRQTRDLTVWLLITLGAVRVGERQQLVSALSELAYTEAKLRARRRRGDAGGLLHLRTAVVELLQAVLHAHKAAVEASWREGEGEGKGEGEGEGEGGREGEAEGEGEGDEPASFGEYLHAAEGAPTGATDLLARLPALLTAVMEAVKKLFTSTEASRHHALTMLSSKETLLCCTMLAPCLHHACTMPAPCLHPLRGQPTSAPSPPQPPSPPPHPSSPAPAPYSSLSHPHHSPPCAGGDQHVRVGAARGQARPHKPQP